MISIHPTALVATTRIGDGTRIWAFVNVLEGATIGRDCNICDRCFVENDVVIETNETAESREFNAILKRDGAKAAIAWRTGRRA